MPLPNGFLIVILVNTKITTTTDTMTINTVLLFFAAPITAPVIPANPPAGAVGAVSAGISTVAAI